jgi:hypothetical protein
MLLAESRRPVVCKCLISDVRFRALRGVEPVRRSKNDKCVVK